MKNKKLLGGTTLALMLGVLSLSFALPAEAVTPSVDVTGNYVIDMEYLGSHYSHDMSLTQDAGGNLTGNGGSPAGSNVYTWMITSGTVSGNSIDFLANYTATADAVTPQTVLHVMGTVAANGSMTGTWSDNYQGGARSGSWSSTSGSVELLGTLAAEDFGVVNYDTGLGMLKGYTAGFGITDNTFAGATSVVVKLYSAGDILMQTNTAILPKFNADITGTQFSSPFDVSGDFDYATDGYWTNVKETQYGQSVPAKKVVATVTLANGKIVTATNTNLTGDPTTIYPQGTDQNKTLTVSLAGNGSGTVTSSPSGINCGADCGESFAMNTSVTLTATPATGSDFSGWSGACSGSGSCVVTMSAAKTVTATFVLESTPPTEHPRNKEECKGDKWKRYTNPSFKNQGQCIRYVNHQNGEGKDDKVKKDDKNKVDIKLDSLIKADNVKKDSPKKDR